MNILIARNPTASFYLFHSPSPSHTARKFFIFPHGRRIPSPTSLTSSFKPLRSSTGYSGWDDFRLVGGSDGPGKSGSDAFLNFLETTGLDDGKHAFTFILGIVSALAITRVKLSSILVFPASVLVFSIGFTVGFFRIGIPGGMSVYGSKRRVEVENLKLNFEKLKGLVEFFDGLDPKVDDLKNDIKNAIGNAEIDVSDLRRYLRVADSISLLALNAKDIIKTLIYSEGKSRDSTTESHNKAGKREAGKGKNVSALLKSVGGLFGENLINSNSAEVKEDVCQETLASAIDQMEENRFTPLVEDQAVNSANSFKGKDKNLRTSGYLLSNSQLDKVENDKRRTTSDTEFYSSAEMDRNARRSISKEEFGYQNNRMRFRNSHNKFSCKINSNNRTDAWESHDNQLDSENVSVRMECTETEASFLNEQMLKKPTGTSWFSDDDEYNSCKSQYRGDKVNNGDHLVDNCWSAHDGEVSSSSSSKIVNDVTFDGYLTEASGLLKQAKDCIRGRHDEKHAETMLYQSAKLLSEAVALKPMSLLAVGQLGNTYLLHGELKLKISRALRTLLSDNIPLSIEKQDRIRILKGFHYTLSCKDEVASILIDVCEECEELLVEAGRKYRLALSIDANDVRALYNWGLALSFRGQLIADIGPDAAFDADKVFLAAIEKFDAMMSKGNVYAPDALLKWGVTLQQRSRLRPSNSKAKVKLLQQAKRLFEDALSMDSNNVQVRESLSLCVSELNHRQFYSKF